MKHRDAPAASPVAWGVVSSSGDNGSGTGNRWQPGQLVRSTAGRDKGRYYLVLAIHDREALLADGRHRPGALPKVKNLRHLQTTHRVAADFDAFLAKGGPTDEQIRAAITKMLGEKE